ncbi:MAG TPA: DUF1573 domain-containing protein, partial [Flavobacteriales bacterium]|nr:DUF1573 domain-containing protein [Flavobacteriales bacterium]
MNFQIKHITMKKLLPLLFCAFFSTPFFAQTGTGIVLLTGPTHTFTPTTVDSASSFDFQLVNTVAIEQTVLFGGLNAPFALADNTPQVVAASDTLDLSISFTPSSIGAFSDTLNVVGTIFGDAMLVVSGDGIQVQLTWVSDTLQFATTAIGQTDTVALSLSSVGDGTAVISDLQFSNSIFTVDSAASQFNIAQGTTDNITFVFAPINAGEFSETVTISTNDPNNSQIVITLLSTGISEVSGEVCDLVWTVVNSPFTLVGDIVVPEGCSLTIDPGVEVNMGGHKLTANGEFVCLGTSEAPITIQGGVVHLGPGAPALIEYLVYEGWGGDVNVDSPYALLYYNNFGSIEGQYDFDCYDQYYNNYHTGTTTSYSSYGCQNFYR